MARGLGGEGTPWQVTPNGNRFEVIQRSNGEMLGSYTNIEKARRHVARLNAAGGNYKRVEDSRTANHIDGYDRDDLGLSPDY